MATVLQHKVVASLPSPLEPNSIYYVRVGQGFDIRVTNGLGEVVAYESNSKLDLEYKVADTDPRLSDSRDWTASVVAQAEAEAGTATTARKWTAQRVRQAAIAAWNGATSAWGRGFVVSADASAARAELGMGTTPAEARRPLRVTDDGAGVQWGGPIQTVGLIDDTVVINPSTGAVSINLSSGSVFDLTLSGNTTLSVTGAPSGGTTAIVVRIRQAPYHNRTVTWWSGITWLTGNGTAPAAPATNKIREYILSFDGTAWIGREGASN